MAIAADESNERAHRTHLSLARAYGHCMTLENTKRRHVSGSTAAGPERAQTPSPPPHLLCARGVVEHLKFVVDAVALKVVLLVAVVVALLKERLQQRSVPRDVKCDAFFNFRHECLTGWSGQGMGQDIVR